MAISVDLDEEFITNVKIHAKTEHRSVSQQIEYWAKIGQLMIDNPELSYEFVHETLLAGEEIKQGLVKRYVRKTKRDHPEFR